MTGTARTKDLQFRQFVDNEVARALALGAIEYETLLGSLPAVYPTEVLASIDRLAAIGAIDPKLGLRIRGDAAVSVVNGRTAHSRPPLLPPPHPLDFEWRFTADTSLSLLDEAVSLTAPDARVLLFGTPGLALEAIKAPPDRHVVFMGENNVVTKRLDALNVAAGEPLDITLCDGGFHLATADAVVLDPPWYIDFIRHMLGAAAAACRLGGTVLVSLPPSGARPSARSDRDSTLRLAGRLGLVLIEERALSICYNTPYFEVNALAAAGVSAPGRWRHGDLAIFRKERTPALPTRAVRRGKRWLEASVGRMRLMVKPELSLTDEPSGLLQLVDGDILPSVSRRDRRRRGAQVWTSGNRVFRTVNPLLVLEAACAGHNIHRKYGAIRPIGGSITAGDALERIRHQLGALSALEAVEELEAASLVIDRRERCTSIFETFSSNFSATLSG